MERGCKKRKLAPNGDASVTDLTVGGNLTVDGTSTLTGAVTAAASVQTVDLTVTGTTQYSSTARLALNERATAPTVVSTSTTFYTDDGTNADCGIQTLRCNAVSGGGYVDAGADHGDTTTWTVGIYDSSSNELPGGGPSASECRWRRVGPIYHINGRIDFSGTSGATGTDLVRIIGLPNGVSIAPGGRQYSGGIIMSGLTWPANATDIKMTYLASNNYARLTFVLSTGAYQDMVINDITSGGVLRFSATLATV